jgi:hypothetical protein
LAKYWKLSYGAKRKEKKQMMVDVSALAAGVAMTAVGVRCYMGIERRIVKLEIMQRLLLKKNGYLGNGDIEEAIQEETRNHKNRRNKT